MEQPGDSDARIFQGVMKRHRRAVSGVASKTERHTSHTLRRTVVSHAAASGHYSEPQLEAMFGHSRVVSRRHYRAPLVGVRGLHIEAFLGNVVNIRTLCDTVMQWDDAAERQKYEKRDKPVRVPKQARTNVERSNQRKEAALEKLDASLGVDAS